MTMSKLPPHGTAWINLTNVMVSQKIPNSSIPTKLKRRQNEFMVLKFKMVTSVEEGQQGLKMGTRGL